MPIPTSQFLQRSSDPTHKTTTTKPLYKHHALQKQPTQVRNSSIRSSIWSTECLRKLWNTTISIGTPEPQQRGTIEEDGRQPLLWGRQPLLCGMQRRRRTSTCLWPHQMDGFPWKSSHEVYKGQEASFQIWLHLNSCTCVLITFVSFLASFLPCLLASLSCVICSVLSTKKRKMCVSLDCMSCCLWIRRLDCVSCTVLLVASDCCLMLKSKYPMQSYFIFGSSLLLILTLSFSWLLNLFLE